MLTYHVIATTIKGNILKFDVIAANTKDARKFGVSTALQLCKIRGMVPKIASIEVEEFYEEFN